MIFRNIKYRKLFLANILLNISLFYVIYLTFNNLEFLYNNKDQLNNNNNNNEILLSIQLFIGYSSIIIIMFTITCILGWIAYFNSEYIKITLLLFSITYLVGLYILYSVIILIPTHLLYIYIFYNDKNYTK